MNPLPLLTIVVPIYNTEKFLNQCLDSILVQTFRNFEVILVDDASTDHSSAIINSYAEKDSRIKIVRHEQNLGLFQARLTGVKNAKGKYIAFVDSDDSIGIDWFRILLEKAENTCSDIVMGNTICEDENHWKYIFNMTASFNKNKAELTGPQIFDSLLSNEGMYFSWHTIWNKIYTRSLWESCLKYFKKINAHFIMTEDICFSFVLYFHAQKMAFVDCDGYFYNRHSNSSTVENSSFEKLSKNVSDLKTSFSFTKHFLKSVSQYIPYKSSYESWKDRYFRWWSFQVNTVTEKESRLKEKQVKQDFLDFFKKSDFETANIDDSSFNALRTSWNGDKEYIKQTIQSEVTKLVSFDVFDTLIVRPFLEPTDLFAFLQPYFDKIYQSDLIIKDIRPMAENICRKKMRFENPTWEDVTLDEIYKTLACEFFIPEDIAQQLKEKEIEYELSFSRQRKTGKELYDLALSLGKKIILVSDMYLPFQVIKAILSKNSYSSFEKLYLSSDMRMLKNTGKLFQAVLTDYSLTDHQQMVHIGDNWEADFLKPKELGIKSIFLPKSKDILLNYLGDQYTGNAIGNAVMNSNSIVYCNSFLKQGTCRCLLALSANEMFDNPYITFNELSDYNANPYYIGNLALGPHLLSLCKWILEDSKKKGYKTIHFLARDGYLPKLVYDLLATAYQDAPKSNYLYASRKSLLPLAIKKKSDLFKILNSVEITLHTPRTVLQLMSDVLLELDQNALDQYKKNAILMDEKFADSNAFIDFINILFEISFSEEKLNAQRKIAAEYFKGQVHADDAIFDLGYSGKLQSYLIDLIGYPVPSYYMHTNGDATAELEKKYHFEISAYYDFTPSMSGIMNEYLFSDSGPSCVGYKKNQQGVTEPVFEKKKLLYSEKYIISEIHRGCLAFINSFVDCFSDYMDFFTLRRVEVSSLYEKFLISPKPLDKNLFLYCYGEDELYGGVSKEPLSSLWDWQLNARHLCLQSIAKQEASQPQAPDNELHDLYQDGLFMSFYKKLNKYYPKGSKKRERLKKLIRILIH